MRALHNKPPQDGDFAPPSLAAAAAPSRLGGMRKACGPAKRSARRDGPGLNALVLSLVCGKAELLRTSGGKAAIFSHLPSLELEGPQEIDDVLLLRGT
jgi:hypothetical protein